MVTSVGDSEEYGVDRRLQPLPDPESGKAVIFRLPVDMDIHGYIHVWI